MLLNCKPRGCYNHAHDQNPSQRAAYQRHSNYAPGGLATAPGTHGLLFEFREGNFPMTAPLSVSASSARARAPVSGPRTVRAMFFVSAQADPGIAPRLIEPFAKRGLVPVRAHISSEDGAGDIRGTGDSSVSHGFLLPFGAVWT